MVKSWEKYINKSPYKLELDKIILDIANNNLDKYYLKQLSWYIDLFRIRKWNIRIVFKKEIDWNSIVAVDTRWQIYRKI